MSSILSVLYTFFCVLCYAQGSTLYGYFHDPIPTGTTASYYDPYHGPPYRSTAPSAQLVLIDGATGLSKLACDLSHLPPLLQASSSARYGTGEVYFYSIDASGAISLVTVSVTTCQATVTPITGLNQGQNDVRDIKYDNVNDKLYMVFPNPFCMHGSLDQINASTGAVISHLTNVGDPEGLGQTAAVSGKSNTYYFVGVPIGASDAITYQLNKVQLTTGNISAINLANNNLDVGDMWGSNYTLNVVVTSTGESVVGAVTPSSTTVQECSPSGFFSIDTVTGNVTCTHGPIEYSVVPLADLDPTTQYFYQVFRDDHDSFYLVTFDAVKAQVVTSVECDICSKLTALSVLP